MPARGRSSYHTGQLVPLPQLSSPPARSRSSRPVRAWGALRRCAAPCLPISTTGLIRATPTPPCGDRSRSSAKVPRAELLLGRLAENRSFVPAAAHFARRKNPVLLDPGERLLEGLLRIRLEDQALARTPAPRIDLAVEALRKFLLVITGVQFRPQVDVALGASQCVEILPHILRIGRAGDHRRHHERCVDDFAKT